MYLQKNEELSSYLGMENMTDLLTDLEYIKEEDEEINMSKRETVPLEVTEDMFTCFYSIFFIVIISCLGTVLKKRKCLII